MRADEHASARPHLAAQFGPLNQKPQGTGQPCGFEQQSMMLDLAQPPDDADGYLVIRNAQFFSQSAATLFHLVEIEAERHDAKLRGTPDAEALADFLPLLFADDNDAIRTQPRQRPLDGNKQTRLCRAIIAVKDVAVISVNDLT